MIRIVTFLILLITGTITAQTLTDDQLAVKKSINVFFEGFHKGDTSLMKSVMLDKFTVQTASINKEGVSVLKTEDSSVLIDAISKRPNDQKWDERLLDYKIQVDGNMANVWTPYEFWFNGKFSHCGVNSFQLFKDNDGIWKIIYLIDTRRRVDCKN